MSNLLFNIRFGTVFWQLTRDWEFSVKRSDWHVAASKQPGFKWFAVYCWFGKHYS